MTSAKCGSDITSAGKSSREIAFLIASASRWSSPGHAGTQRADSPSSPPAELLRDVAPSPGTSLLSSGFRRSTREHQQKSAPTVLALAFPEVTSAGRPGTLPQYKFHRMPRPVVALARCTTGSLSQVPVLRRCLHATRSATDRTESRCHCFGFQIGHPWAPPLYCRDSFPLGKRCDCYSRFVCDFVRVATGQRYRSRPDRAQYAPAAALSPRRARVPGCQHFDQARRLRRPVDVLDDEKKLFVLGYQRQRFAPGAASQGRLQVPLGVRSMASSTVNDVPSTSSVTTSPNSPA